MKIPKIIQEAANKHRLCQMEYVGQLNGMKVYVETNNIDENGLPEPTGLPCCIVLENGKAEFIGGDKAIDLLNRFD